MTDTDQATRRIEAFLPEFVNIPDEHPHARLGAEMFANDVRAVLADRDRMKTELDAHIQANSADAAAGSYAQRAETAEADRDQLATRLTACRSEIKELYARIAGLESELSGGSEEWGIRPEAGLGDEYVLDGYTEAGARHHATRYAPSGRPVRRRTGRWIDAEEPIPTHVLQPLDIADAADRRHENGDG